MKDKFTEAAIGEDAHVTTVSLYTEYLRRTKEKAEEKKSARKSKKKNLPKPMERCEKLFLLPPRFFPEIKVSVNKYVAHRDG